MDGNPAGLIGRFTYIKTGNVCSFKVDETTYYSDYAGETLDYLPTGSNIYTDSSCSQDSYYGKVASNVTSYTITYGPVYCAFSLEYKDQSGQTISTPMYYATTKDYTKDGKLLKCFNVNGQYRDSLQLLTVLNNFSKEEDTNGAYKFALQDNSPISGPHDTTYTNYVDCNESGRLPEEAGVGYVTIDTDGKQVTKYYYPKDRRFMLD